jgi:hypothetical protein
MPEVDCVRPSGYLYPFQSFSGRLLYAGHLPDGQQVLVGPLPPGALVLRFALGGGLATVEKHTLPELRDRDHLKREVVACFERMGVVPGTIRVRRFSSGNPGSPLEEIERRDGCVIGIEDLPSDGMEEAEEERWLSSGSYVLEWGDSYYVGEDGQVFCT